MLHEGLPDEVLMAEFCRELDDDVFRELACRHYEKAVQIAQQRLGRFSLAQEAVQESLIRVVRYRKRYSPGKPFVPWFHSILRNVCTDIYRKESRQTAALQQFAERMPALVPDEGAKRRAGDLTRALPEDDRRLLEWRFLHGFSHAEIAERLNCSLDTTKKRFQRLIERLKQTARR